MQRGNRQPDADRIAHRKPAGIVDHELAVAHGDSIPVEAAWIRRLDDAPPQDEVVGGVGVRRREAGRLAAEVRDDRTGYGRSTDEHCVVVRAGLDTYPAVDL